MIRGALLAVCMGTLGGVIFAAGCGGNDALVGGSCAAGYTQCGTSCVDLMSNHDNCGACGNVCSDAVECLLSECVSPSEGAAPPVTDAEAGVADANGPRMDASTDGPSSEASTNDATITDSSTEDSASPSDASEGGTGLSDGAASEAALAEGSAADGAMADATSEDSSIMDAASGDGTATEPDANGSASEAAPADDGPTEAGQGVDGPSCAPLVDCSGVCVDVTQDVSNCGSCGNSCYSGICTQSACVGASSGAFVLVGHDFESYSPAQATLLLNALLLARGTSVPVLTYERYSSSAALTSIRDIAASAVNQIGRSIVLTETTSDMDVANLQVGKYGVLLVPDQPSASSGSLTTLGQTWATTLQTYTQEGGVVVVLDGDTGIGEMPALSSGTGLLAVTGHQAVSAGDALDVLAGADALAVGVGNTYAAGFSSASFTTESSGGNVVYVVMTPGDIAPVVVHKVF